MAALIRADWFGVIAPPRTFGGLENLLAGDTGSRHRNALHSLT
jgi:hypothetical protein